jgi:hypothetical protein
MLQVRDARGSTEGLVRRECDGQVKNRGFWDDEDLMTNGAEIFQVSRRPDGQRLGRGQITGFACEFGEGGKNAADTKNLHGRRQACQASEEPMHDAALGNGSRTPPCFRSELQHSQASNKEPTAPASSNQTSAPTFTIPYQRPALVL